MHNKSTFFIIAIMFPFLISGCLVLESKYTKKVAEADALQQKFNDLTRENNTLKDKIKGLTSDRDQLKEAFANATKDLVFYTDGDAQYDPRELKLLMEALTDEVDMVNGYKILRHDPLHRIIIGGVYQHFVRIIFGLKLRDPDCDFRVMRRLIFDKIDLESDSGVICVEMMKKIGDNNFSIAEVPVHHYHRAYGKSQFFNFRRLFRVAVDLSKLWVRLVIRKEHLKTGRVASSLKIYSP